MLAVKCDNVLMGVPWESFFFFFFLRGTFSSFDNIYEIMLQQQRERKITIPLLSALWHLMKPRQWQLFSSAPLQRQIAETQTLELLLKVDYIFIMFSRNIWHDAGKFVYVVMSISTPLQRDKKYTFDIIQNSYSW